MYSILYIELFKPSSQFTGLLFTFSKIPYGFDLNSDIT